MKMCLHAEKTGWYFKMMTKKAFSLIFLTLLLFSVFTNLNSVGAQLPVAQDLQGSIKLDNSEYVVTTGHTTAVKISGKINDGRGDKITLTITKPDGSTDQIQAFLTNSGVFTSIFMLDQNSEIGNYKITGDYYGTVFGSASFVVNSHKSATGTTPTTATSTGYKPYKNDQYGFSIEYPQNWNLVEHLGSQYSAKTILISPDDNFQINAGVLPNTNPYAGLTSQEILGSITGMMRDGCYQSTLQNRGFTCTNPQFNTTTTSYRGTTIYTVVMIWTRTLGDGSSVNWFSVWGMMPYGNDVWLLIMESSADEIVKYGKELSYISNSYDIFSIPEPIPEQNVPAQQQSQTPAIPSWVKNNVKWWSEGSLTDDDFVKAIQYLIQKKIIQVTATSSVSSVSRTVPSFVKNTAKWWSEGQVSDSDFIKGIQYLVENGIIVTTENTFTTSTQSTNKETSSDVISEAFLYSGKYLTPQTITYTDKNGKSLTMLAYPGQALLVVSQDTSLDTVSQMVTSNGGTVLAQVPKLGFYLVKIDDVAKFITYAYQSKFVTYVGPNGIDSPRALRVQSDNFQYYEVQNIDDWQNISSPDPKAKVLLVQIDDFSGEDSLTGTVHGVDVSKQSDPESRGISVLHLNTDFSHANVAINLQVAAWLAEKYNQKLVINTSFGPNNKDKNPQIEEADTKMLLAPLMNTRWFQQGNVILAKAAGNDGADISSQSSNLQNDPIFGTASRSFITTGEVNDDSKLTQYERGTSSNYGNGVVFATSNPSCGSGTSCATYTTATTAAYIWSLHPDIKSGSMTEIIKTSSTPPSGGNYPIVSMENAYNEANRVTNCSPNCLPLGAKTNTGINSANQQTSTAPATPLTTIPSNSVAISPLQIHVNGGSCTVNKYCDVLIATSTGGLAPYHFQSDTFRNGTPPFGMTIGIYGHMTGIPTREGSYNFGVCVVDTAGKSDCSTTTLTIKPSEPTVNLTGHWSGTFTLVDVYEGITCKFQSTFESDLIQNGNAVSGTVSYASASSETTLAGGTTPIHCSFSGLTYSLSGSVSSSSFTLSSSDGALHASGSFTSNAIQGTFTACGAEGCDSGSFQGSRR